MTAALAALALALFSVWCATRWTPAVIPAILFVLSSVAVLFLASRPPIEIRQDSLRIGGREVRWADVRRLDRTGWISPLVIRLTLADESHFVLIYPGDLDSSNSLLRQLRRSSREALIDGIPYRQFWGETIPQQPEKTRLPSPRYHVLRPEDEAEVERLFQRLKAVGHIDPKTFPDEK